MIAVCNLFFTICKLVFYAVTIDMILSWLLAFDLLNRHNQVVVRVYDTLQRVTAPLFAPIRRFLPTVNGIDLAPLVFLLLLQFVSNLVREYVCRPAFF